ncbi:FecCD family ABC transporter permease [Actinomyces haliotis]|uniref:FecCD family ABC transporter permease n=1 Tax=Actinomyces haliotis TaxID=1280843 RepID=UPI00188DCFCB|nr:iron chelate uptake ABC transporter family permease subunit [Actinomyces haliotis]
MTRRRVPALPVQPDRPVAPPGQLVLGRRWSLLLRRRSLLVTLGALLVAGLGVLVGLSTGTFPVSPRGLLTILRGSGDPTARYIVLDQRLPRVVAALAIGGTLGVSGAFFQSVSRNPLGSPDVVGFTRGASTGGILALLVLGSTSIGATSLGAVLGGALTAVLVIALGARSRLRGETLILVGIAVGQMLAALNDYLLAASDLESAEAARTWQHGSLNAITWASVRPLLVLIAIVLPLGLVLAVPGRVLELGDDAAAGLGMRVARTRLVLIGYGVVLASACVAVSGPIGFLALAAPQVAARLTRTTGLGVLPAGAVGAALLLGADLAAGRLLSPFQIPVGLLTSALGGFYLLWLLSSAEPGRRA